MVTFQASPFDHVFSRCIQNFLFSPSKKPFLAKIHFTKESNFKKKIHFTSNPWSSFSNHFRLYHWCYQDWHLKNQYSDQLLEWTNLQSFGLDSASDKDIQQTNSSHTLETFPWKCYQVTFVADFWANLSHRGTEMRTYLECCWQK